MVQRAAASYSCMRIASTTRTDPPAPCSARRSKRTKSPKRAFDQDLDPYRQDLVTCCAVLLLPRVAIAKLLHARAHELVLGALPAHVIHAELLSEMAIVRRKLERVWYMSCDFFCQTLISKTVLWVKLFFPSPLTKR